MGRALVTPHTPPHPRGSGTRAGRAAGPDAQGRCLLTGSRSSFMACSRRGGLEPGSRRGRAPRPREASLRSGPRGRPRGRQPAWVRDVPRGSAQCPSAARAPLGLSPLQGARLPARPGQGRGAPTGKSHPAAHGRAPPLPAPGPQPPCGLRPLGHQTDPERTEVDAAHRANRPPSEGPFEGGPRGAGARARVLPVRGHLFARREGA